MASYERKDFYYRKAKASGFASRASFKILEIIDKYHMIQPGMIVVDLGSAPGGWLQILSEAVGPSGQVIGIDIKEIKEPFGKNVTFIQGDIREPRTRQQLLAELGRKVDLVFSDLAPHTTGISFQDSFNSVELVMEALEICRLVLKENGTFTAKVLAGAETPLLRSALETSFLKIQGIYPKATRQGSREFYLLCRSFKTQQRAAA